LRYQEVPEKLSGELEEKYGPVRKDWGCGQMVMGFEEGSMG